jgi:sialic acid synthase
VNRYEIDEVYIVAEIGQNHNGDINIAKALIDDAAEAGCSAVKSAKRDLSCELSKEAYNRPYNSPNSFGKTYGQHREFLELSEEDHRLLKKYTNNRRMDYFLSVCDIPSLEFALSLDPPLVKVPSKEICNLALLEKVAECGKPVAFSIGLATGGDILTALKIFFKKNTDATIIVCTSEYPTDLDNIHLNRINNYKKAGFSSHCPDPMLGIAAVAMGARYIEFHTTLDRTMKGTDQQVALEFDEMVYMAGAIKDLMIALGSDEIPNELPRYLQATKKKMMKVKQEDGVYRIP